VDAHGNCGTKVGNLANVQRWPPQAYSAHPTRAALDTTEPCFSPLHTEGEAGAFPRSTLRPIANLESLMIKHALSVRLEAKPGKEAEVAQFLE
jgi:hypothetical protein